MTDEKTPTVWVVNYANHNLEQAKNFGMLVYLTEGTINPFVTDRLTYQIKEKLVSASKDDWLLLTGAPILNIIAFTILMFRFGRVRVLIWDVINSRYVGRELISNPFAYDTPSSTESYPTAFNEAFPKKEADNG